MKVLGFWVYILFWTSILVSVLYPFQSPLIRYTPAVVVMVLILQLWILYLIKSQERPVLPRTTASWALYCYLSSVMITVVVTGGKTIVYSGTGLVLLVGYVFMYNFFKHNEGNKLKFVKALHTSGMIFSTLGILFFLLDLNYPPGSAVFHQLFGNVKLGDRVSISSLFHNENIFGGLLLYSIPATLMLCSINKAQNRTLHGRYYLISAVLLTLVLWKSDARAAWIGTAVSVAYMTSALLRRRIGLILLVAAAVVIAGAIWVEKTPFEILAMIEDPGLRGRLILWKEGLTMVPSSPIIGVGLGRTRSAIELLLRSPVKVQTMHNAYLRMAVEQGLLGLSIFLWFLVAVLQSGLKKVRLVQHQADKKYINFAVGVFLGNLVYFLFEDPVLGGLGFQSFFFICIVAMILSIDIGRRKHAKA